MSLERRAAAPTASNLSSERVELNDDVANEAATRGTPESGRRTGAVELGNGAGLRCITSFNSLAC
jgi:hypothetical protein